MVNAKQLKDEHDSIEQELVELEVIMGEEEINYPNLNHVFRKLCVIWDEHEKAEEKFFYSLKDKNYGIPYRQILFAHGVLGKYRKEMLDAINSGSEFKTKKALGVYGGKIIKELREHMKQEDEILYRLPEELVVA